MSSGLQAPPVSATEFRRVLAHLPTGVTVISAMRNGAPIGMAANSVTSVSLDPPLVSFCAARSSTTWPEIRKVERFTVSVMGAGDGDICRRFGRRGTDRFAGLAWHARACGPGLDRAVAWIDCAVDAEHPAGDHTIVVARVIDLEAADAVAPLVFFLGGYGTFGDLERSEGDG